MRTPIVMMMGAARSGKDTAGARLAKELGGVCVALADPMKRFLCDPEGFGLSVAQCWGAEKELPFTRNQPSLGALVALVETHFGVDDPDVVAAFEEALDEWLVELPDKTTPRHMLQTFGTDCVREGVDPDFWIDQGLDIADDLLLGGYGIYEREQGIVDDPEGAPTGVVVLTDGRFRNEVLPVKRVGGYVVRVERPGALLSLAGAAAAHVSETEMASIPAWWCDAVVQNDAGLAQFEEKARRLAHTLATGTL